MSPWLPGPRSFHSTKRPKSQTERLMTGKELMWNALGGHDIKIIKARNYSAYHGSTLSALVWVLIQIPWEVGLYYSSHFPDEKIQGSWRWSHSPKVRQWGGQTWTWQLSSRGHAADCCTVMETKCLCHKRVPGSHLGTMYLDLAQCRALRKVLSTPLFSEALRH